MAMVTGADESQREASEEPGTLHTVIETDGALRVQKS